jgi:hypothetical protein
MAANAELSLRLGAASAISKRDMHNPFEAIGRRLSTLETLLTEVLQHLCSSSSAKQDEFGGMELVQEVTRLSKAHLYALVAARQIPHAKRGNKLYFTRADRPAWIAAGRRSSREK